MSLKCLLFDLITRIELLEPDWDEIFLNISMVILITDVITKKMQFFVLIIDQLQDEFLHIFLILR